jgi:hypothetical protein
MPSHSVLDVCSRGEWSVKMEKPKDGFPLDCRQQESLASTCSTNVRHVHLGTMLRPVMRVKAGGTGNQRSTSLCISTNMMHHLTIHSYYYVHKGISADKLNRSVLEATQNSV